jgi:hypothetical protein
MNVIEMFPFPGVAILNKSQFDEYKESHLAIHDYRYATEQLYVGDKDIVILGFCPLRGVSTRFKSPIDLKKPKTDRTPDWLETQTCEMNIKMAERACAHYAIYDSGGATLGQALVISNSDGLMNVMGPYVSQLDFSSIDALEKNKSKYDTILVSNCISNVQDLQKSLSKLKDRLNVNGKVYITLNFHYNSSTNEKHLVGDMIYWSIGWDFLSQITNVGFKSSQAITFWSQELGYFGPHNFIFEARL